MLSYIGRSGQLAPTLKGTSQAVAGGLRNIIPGVVDGQQVEVVASQPPVLTTTTMAKSAPHGLSLLSQVLQQALKYDMPIRISKYQTLVHIDVILLRIPMSKLVNQKLPKTFTYLLAGGKKFCIMSATLLLYAKDFTVFVSRGLTVKDKLLSLAMSPTGKAQAGTTRRTHINQLSTNCGTSLKLWLYHQ
nr:uncharacterized protein LOC128697374 [Cherax quadricarinatus]